MTNTSLVTGAAGFIGSHVVDEVLALGDTVVALDDLSGGFPDNISPDAVFVEGTIYTPSDEVERGSANAREKIPEAEQRVKKALTALEDCQKRHRN